MQNSTVQAESHTSISNRHIDSFYGNSGPTIIILCGLHGNEPAGITAFQRIISKLKSGNIQFSGNLHGFRGNLKALEQKERFIDEDMNRNWNVFLKGSKNINGSLHENLERKELLDQILNLTLNAKEPVIFFDLHSTSAPSIPFIAINDSLYNRQIVKGIPVPVILGLQEQIEGTLNGTLNDLGLPCILFEAGQHDDPETINIHESFLWYMLYKMACISKNSQKFLRKYKSSLQKAAGPINGYFEVTYRHDINTESLFVMAEGYKSFQKVQKGEVLAEDYNGNVKSPSSDLIFMPLYQSKGNDGFFLIRRIRPIWISLSKALRRRNLDNWIHYLPGVVQDPVFNDSFIINTKIARFLALPVFHLLGYRKKLYKENHLVVGRIQYDDHPPSIAIFSENLAKLLNS